MGGFYRSEWSPYSKKSGSNLPPDKRPGDGDPLLLATRQLRALAPDVGVVPKVGGDESTHLSELSQKLTDCVVPLRQPRHEAVDVGLLGGVDDLLHGDLPRVVAILNVLGDGAVEEGGLLRDDAQVGADEGQVQAADVLPLEGERAAVQVVEPLDELDDGGLAATFGDNAVYQIVRDLYSR